MGGCGGRRPKNRLSTEAVIAELAAVGSSASSVRSLGHLGRLACLDGVDSLFLLCGQISKLLSQIPVKWLAGPACLDGSAS